MKRSLGIECGASTTLAVCSNGAGSPTETEPWRGQGANLQHSTDTEILNLFESIRSEFGEMDAVGACFAGCRTEKDRARALGLARRVWAEASIQIGSDLDAALLAAGPLDRARVLILSGTGSALVGSRPDGFRLQFGGWGAVLGDKGSGYEIGLRGLKACVYYLDRDGRWPELGARLLERLNLDAPNSLIAWAASADKSQVAALAEVVFEAFREGDAVASDIVDGAAASLSKDARALGKRLVGDNSEPMDFVYHGGVLIGVPELRGRIRDRLEADWPGSTHRALERPSVWGALALAEARHPEAHAVESAPIVEESFVPNWTALDRSPTEARNPRSMRLGAMTAIEAVDLFLDEEPLVVAGLRERRQEIAVLVDALVATYAAGGRLFYVGAGTSGRLGALDASELPPTFRADPNQTQAVIAGGPRAFWRAVEGAEDSADLGAESVCQRGVGEADIVVGIASSGRTPFVWGALGAAHRRGATTALLCFNPAVESVAPKWLDHCLAMDVGPELLTGSTRLKSGTATKLVLNMLTTIAMARGGKVIENLMVDVNPTNEKLRRRAARIVSMLTGMDPSAAHDELVAADWNVKRVYERWAHR